MQQQTAKNDTVYSFSSGIIPLPNSIAYARHTPFDAKSDTSFDFLPERARAN
jgi:hypothetical protein